ncbi:MAG: hypothetical protein A2Y69_11765 [Candidatus Aminicenantes bacterium RBG_13_59_9]|nr:MAG: hypothetical protein A2Y69_11765 [Candidatus Aminicenantes bacterium RBG_13_59_9]
MILWPIFCQPETPRVELLRDDASGRVQILIDGHEALAYQHASTLDLPHYWPLNSPAGKNMLVQRTEPYPHHRSFWFADTVRLNGGREVSLYYSFNSGRKIGENLYEPPFRDHIRHLQFTRLDARNDQGVVEAELVWEMDGDRPILKEERRLIVYALKEGEYFLDLTFKLTSAFGEVEFISDDVHYAWPFLRLETKWSGENGGVIITDTGTTGQEATNMKAAKWIDYSNTVDGETAGVAVFQWPDGKEHRWLTREYGCFGPRRPDDQSGKTFTLKKGESIMQRVGVLVHKGDSKEGRVTERYSLYVGGKWPR